MNLNELTIKQASEKMDKGEITSVELTKACLERIKEVDGKIKACLAVCEAEALEEARIADERRSKGENNPLLGAPYLAKMNIMTKGIETNAASKILDGYIAPYDATIIKKLKEAGAVLLGKTNMDEFAHGASTENSAYGPTHNPWDLDKVPGGSSGGSAASVAADMCIFSLGTDTGGSIRQPASFCGVVGLKPTYGKASRFGLISMTSSTDVPGPVTKTVEDAEIVLSAISGIDKNDATTSSVDENNSEINNDIKGLSIGIDEQFFQEGTSSGVIEAVRAASKKFEELGAKLVPINLRYTDHGIPVYYIITPSEISSNLARHDGIKYGFSEKDTENLMETYTKSRGKGFGPEVKRRIMLGTYALSAGYYDAYYLKAQKVRTRIKEEMDDVLKTVDCILTPTSPHSAFKIGEQSDDPMKMYLEDIFVTGASLAGLPAISIPCGFDGSMPIGMQLIGKRFDEKVLFRIGNEYEKNTDWHKTKANI